MTDKFHIWKHSLMHMASSIKLQHSLLCAIQHTQSRLLPPSPCCVLSCVWWLKDLLFPHATPFSALVTRLCTKLFWVPSLHSLLFYLFLCLIRSNFSTKYHRLGPLWAPRKLKSLPFLHSQQCFGSYFSVNISKYFIKNLVTYLSNYLIPRKNPHGRITFAQQTVSR